MLWTTGPRPTQFATYPAIFRHTYKQQNGLVQILGQLLPGALSKIVAGYILNFLHHYFSETVRLVISCESSARSLTILLKTRLCAMKHHTVMSWFQPPAGFEPVIPSWQCQPLSYPEVSYPEEKFLSLHENFNYCWCPLELLSSLRENILAGLFSRCQPKM